MAFSLMNVTTLCLKKCTNFERVLLRIVEIDFDDFGQKYSKVSIIEFACFSFHIGLLLWTNFSSLIPDTKNNANFDAVSCKRGNFDGIQ